MAKIKDEIRVQTDALNHRYHIIYDKAGQVHKIGQLQDAISACETGAYFATRPVVDQKKRK
ncbi:MAG: hypothetical protein ABIN18_14405 [Pseudomonadota bacterium]